MAGTTEKDRAWIESNMPQNAEFSDETDRIAKLDLQGPLSGRILEEMVGTTIINDLKRFTFTVVDVDDIAVTLIRTGYTGELGYELFFPKEDAVKIWDKLMAFDEVLPVGLGARDTLRLEMGYSLYGSDIDEERTPVEAGLERFVDI